MDRPTIALLTDFGDRDFFVASMKGVIIGINPDVRLVDIGHLIPSYSPETAAFQLWAVRSFFRPGTIFLTVVDPGVGTQRKVLLAATRAGYYYVAPDNGILSMVLREDPPRSLHWVSECRYALPHVSRTFEGRDRMAPAAAWLSRGIPCEKFGPECVSYIELETPGPQKRKDRLIGSIIYIDTFGNAITNLPGEWIEEWSDGAAQELICMIGKEEVPLGKSYADAADGAPLFLEGSMSLMEIAVCRGSAAERWQLRIGDEFTVLKRKAEADP